MMFWNYPVAIPFYLIVAVLLLAAFVPRYVEFAVKSRVFWISGALLFTVGMLLLPSRNHLMGDGMQRLADESRTIMYTEPLDTLLHRLVYLIVGSSLWSFRIVGFVTGLFYLNGIRLLRRLGTSPIEKAIIALSFICTATIQFYFGYVESYGLANLFILYYMYFGWKCVAEDRITAAPALFFVLATLSHISAAAVFPSLVYLYKDRFRLTVRIAVPLIVFSVATVFVTGQYWKHLVVLMPNEWSAYSLFSGAHWRDLLSVLLIVSPAFYFAFFGKRHDKITIFAIVGLAGTLLFYILIDPVLGAVRDWDMLSLLALPLAAVIALRTPRKAIVVVILAATIAGRIVPWLIFNSQLQTEYLKGVLAKDIHYSAQFAHGERLDSWGYWLSECGDDKGAEDAWKARLAIDPNWVNTWTMLGRLQRKEREYPDALRTYARLMLLEPENQMNRYYTVYLLFRMGVYDRAQQLLADGPEDFRKDTSVERLRAGILGATGHDEEAVALIEKDSVEDYDGYLPYTLARSCLKVGKIDLARRLIDRAVELDSANFQYRELWNEIGQR